MESLCAHDFGDGIKLMEFGSSGSGTMSALALLLAGEGRWAGHRIAIVGDYAEESDLVHIGVDARPLYTPRQNAEENREAYPDDYNLPGESYPLDISAEAGQMLIDAGIWTGPSGGWSRDNVNRDYDEHGGADCLVVNIDLKEALNPVDFGEGRKLGEFVTGYFGGVLTALAVVLSCSNGRGGGDYRGPKAEPEHATGIAGRWAGDRIAIVPATGSGAWSDISPALRTALASANEASYTVDDDGKVVKLAPTWAS